jgi:hypothetical protein
MCCSVMGRPRAGEPLGLSHSPGRPVARSPGCGSIGGGRQAQREPPQRRGVPRRASLLLRRFAQSDEALRPCAPPPQAASCPQPWLAGGTGSDGPVAPHAERLPLGEHDAAPRSRCRPTTLRTPRRITESTASYLWSALWLRSIRWPKRRLLGGGNQSASMVGTSASSCPASSSYASSSPSVAWRSSGSGRAVPLDRRTRARVKLAGPHPARTRPPLWSSLRVSPK